jgi:RNA polymerase sigma factor (sigma-70 family)
VGPRGDVATPGPGEAMKIQKALLALQSQMMGYAKAIGSAPDEADDLVQAAIARALAADHAPGSVDDLRPWMFRSIRRLYLDRRRKAKVRTEFAAQRERQVGDGSASATDGSLSGPLVRRAFQSLSSDHREMLFLVDIMGMRYGEAAGVLGVSENAVMCGLSRARRSILDRIEGTNVTPMRDRRRRRLS